MKSGYTILLVFGMVAFGCESYLFESDQSSEDPYQNFDYLWQECKDRYSYFDLKEVDWEQVGHNYRALLYDDISSDSLFTVMGNMLTELKDGHSNLISSYDVSYYNISGLGQDNFDWRIVKDHYLPEHIQVTGPFSHAAIANGQIGYVRFGSFSGEVGNSNMDYLISKYYYTDGLIFDIRENGGGDPTDYFFILSRFVTEKTLIYYSQIKNGKGTDDFAEPKAAYLSPSGLHYKGKVVVLTDRGTYSAGSFMSLATKALPNVILVGDTTGGGLGAPNGGQLPNGWTYRFSVSRALTLDLDDSYEKGVPPDVVASFDWNDLTKDEILEAAISEILDN